MNNKFLQRALPNNILTVSRSLKEDLEALKFRDMSGKSIPSAGSGGLTVAIASVTTSNVTGVEDTHHILNLSGLTANRDFNLPTPSAAGVRCKVSISTGNNSYSLIVKANGTEIERLFITNESVEYTATGTGAGDWQLSQDNTISCLAVMERSTAQTITSGTTQKVQLNSAPINVGGLADVVTNFRATIRRNGNYDIGIYAMLFNIDDAERVLISLRINGVEVDVGVSFSPAENKNLTAQMVKKYALTAGQTVEMYIFHDEGGNLDTNTTYKPQMWVEEISGAAGAGSSGSVVSPAATEIEVNLGSTWIWRGRFTITDAAISASKKVLVWLAPGPYTGKGTQADEMEFTPIEITGVVAGLGSAVVTWETKPIYAQVPVVANGARNTNSRFDPQYTPTRINRVRGNVKFYYQILN